MRRWSRVTIVLNTPLAAAGFVIGGLTFGISHDGWKMSGSPEEFASGAFLHTFGSLAFLLGLSAGALAAASAFIDRHDSKNPILRCAGFVVLCLSTALPMLVLWLVWGFRAMGGSLR